MPAPGTTHPVRLPLHRYLPPAVFAMRGLHRFFHPSTSRGRAAIVAVLVTLGLAYGYGAARGDTAGELEGTLLAQRFTTGRLTKQTAWQPCTPVDTAALVPRGECGGQNPQSQRITDLAREARPPVSAADSLATLRTNALLDLRFADTSTVTLRRAAATLEQAVLRAPEDAGLRSELAVAHLAVAERTQDLDPLLLALESVEQAALLDPLRPEILFNRALVLQRLYLVASAQRAWTRYLAVERDRRWRAEAQGYARALAQVADTVSWDSLLTAPPARMDSATRAAIVARVRRSPQAARDSAFTLMGAWGRAHLADSAARAARLLSVAREIGAAAVAMDADRSIAHAVAAIDSAADEPARLATLARGHAALGQSFQDYYAAAYERADAAARSAERELRGARSPAARWAAFYRAAALMNLGKFTAAEGLYRSVAHETPSDEPALMGRTIWGRGVSRVRQGYYDAAIQFYRQAEPYSIRAHEGENLAAIAYLVAESYGLLGQVQGSRVEGLRGLRLLAPYRRSNFLNNHVTTVASLARSQGLSYAAHALMGEVLEIARSLGKPEVVARAYRAEARDLIVLGQWTAARTALTEGLRWADQLPRGAGRDRTTADVRMVLGQLLTHENPRRAYAVLRDVAATYNSVGIQLHVPVAHFEAAVAAEAASEPALARAHLVTAIEYLERQQDSLRKVADRTAFHETVENVFDAAVRLELAAGRPDSAFAFLERARAAIQPMLRQDNAHQARSERVEITRLAAALPPDVLFVDYALLADRLAIWTVSRRGWRHHVVSVRRDSVAALVERFRQELGETNPRNAPARAALYDLLIRPLEGDLGSMRRLTVVPDRELYQVPFAALWNDRTRRFVVEDLDVATVPSAAFQMAAATPAGLRQPIVSALVVGNPTLDSSVARQLPSLPGAVREARQVAAMYPRDRLLLEEDAGREPVLEQLSQYSVVHFAGHAVFNSARPELSYLALASDSTVSGGRLPAWEIGELHLSNVQLVVLSACSTLSPRPSRAGAAAGLAYSFLRAGVPATVSTLWDVHDDVTTPLLTDFHRRFASGATAPEALRQAQIQSLRSPRPELRAPSAWAAFIYTGP
ncbi:CHAT domain-containing protein [Longimicrobium sp.]|uniref:CHAT domain-containing protein n=1 Tax=Longimicrobium sp. TaxID=2029185 RepID=UPI002E31DF01|nr:CHAT domain-containing protein [Longimicrobium sp.]HEX6042155.1 CHAT domain-containing protein [Longimicrobium sp.]